MGYMTGEEIHRCGGNEADGGPMGYVIRLLKTAV